MKELMGALYESSVIAANITKAGCQYMEVLRTYVMSKYGPPKLNGTRGSSTLTICMGACHRGVRRGVHSSDIVT